MPKDMCNTSRMRSHGLKRGINGIQIHVCGKHLPKYLGEFENRWNMGQVPQRTLDRLLFSFTRLGVARVEKLLRRMRQNPKADWRIEQIQTLCVAYKLSRSRSIGRLSGHSSRTWLT